MKISDFKPLEDMNSVVNIGGLSIENGLDSLLVTGAVELSRDEASVERALQLANLFSIIASKLDADVKNGVLATSDDDDSVTEISNPF